MPSKKDPPEEKACSTCKEIKKIDDFYKKAQNVDGYMGYCKDCFHMKDEERKARKAEEAKNPVPKVELPKPTATKTCSGCNECKTVDNFHKDGNKDDGYHTRCKICRETEKVVKVKLEVDEKVCTKCKEIKKIDDFPERKEAKDGHRNECKECLAKKYPLQKPY